MPAEIRNINVKLPEICGVPEARLFIASQPLRLYPVMAARQKYLAGRRHRHLLAVVWHIRHHTSGIIKRDILVHHGMTNTGRGRKIKGRKRLLISDASRSAAHLITFYSIDAQLPIRGTLAGLMLWRSHLSTRLPALAHASKPPLSSTRFLKPAFLSRSMASPDSRSIGFSDLCA
jgi:hypothetical protein